MIKFAVTLVLVPFCMVASAMAQTAQDAATMMNQMTHVGNTNTVPQGLSPNADKKESPLFTVVEGGVNIGNEDASGITVNEEEAAPATHDKKPNTKRGH